MNELENFLKNSPYIEELETWGYLGEDIFEIKTKLTTFNQFKDKDIFIMNNPIWPKTGHFFILTKDVEHRLSDVIFIYAIYITQNNNIIMNCSEDSFIN